MPEQAQQKRRTNRVFKSLHKPLTYLGVERTLFYFVCVSAVGASGVRLKPANGGQGKTGQRKWPGTKLFYPVASC
jgi:hypothetical protein